MCETSPIILIGAARSGTKFLRDILASAEGVKCVPYDVNYIWRHGQENAPDDVLDLGALTDKTKRYIVKSLNDLAEVKKGDILLEKTVSNTLRVKYVDAVFPNARYVHIVRDGMDVVESSMRQWQKKPDLGSLLIKLKRMPFGSSRYVFWFGSNFIAGLFDRRGGGSVWGPRFPGFQEITSKSSLAETCALQWRESVTRATRDLADLPRSDERVTTISYADFVESEDALRALATKLELPDIESIVSLYKEKLSPSKPELWRVLLKEDISLARKIVDSVNLEVLG